MTPVPPSLIVDGYALMVVKRINKGFTPCLLTFMFNQINASPASRARIMLATIEETYSRFVTRVFRRPAKENLLDLPLWIGGLDWPVPKADKDTFAHNAVNDGQHVHMVALTPPDSRLKGHTLSYHFEVLQDIYFRHPLMRISTREIDERPDYVTEYVLKSVTRRRIGTGEVIVLPKAHSEMPASKSSLTTPRMFIERRLTNR